MIAAAGTFLFADSTGYLLTDLASQAIASLHRSDKTQGNSFYQHSSSEPNFAKIGELQHCRICNIARRQKSRGDAMQSSMQSIKRNAAGGARSGYAITFIAGDIQGKQHAVIADIRPLPAHQIPSAMLLLDFANNRYSHQPAPDLIFHPPHASPTNQIRSQPTITVLPDSY